MKRYDKLSGGSEESLKVQDFLKVPQEQQHHSLNIEGLMDQDFVGLHRVQNKEGSDSGTVLSLVVTKMLQHSAWGTEEGLRWSQVEIGLMDKPDSVWGGSEEFPLSLEFPWSQMDDRGLKNQLNSVWGSYEKFPWSQDHDGDLTDQLDCMCGG